MLFSLIILLNGVDISLYESALLLFISFISNSFSAISGGGAGLIQLPALILSGIPYYQALATHKLATVALGIGGSLRNYKSLRNDLSVFWQIIIFGIPGVILGSFIVEFISEKYLYLILGIFSVLLAVYSFRRAELGLLSADKKLYFLLNLRFVILIFFIGILNGSISSGTGLLVTILLIKTFGMDFLRAISMTFFTVGIFWNALGAISLSRIGSIPIHLSILLFWFFSGGYFGAHLSHWGNKLIRRLFFSLFIGRLSLLFKFIKVFLN